MVDALLGQMGISTAELRRAVLCSQGKHEPWERPAQIGSGAPEPVYLDIQSKFHGEVHCAICKHCRVLYVRTKNK